MFSTRMHRTDRPYLRFDGTIRLRPGLFPSSRNQEQFFITRPFTRLRRNNCCDCLLETCLPAPPTTASSSQPVLSHATQLGSKMVAALPQDAPEN